jgi:hypothetical protein
MSRSAMDRQDKRTDANSFSETDLAADAGRVVARAAESGTAVVAASDGRPLLVISIPTTDLPTLD